MPGAGLEPRRKRAEISDRKELHPQVGSEALPPDHGDEICGVQRDDLDVQYLVKLQMIQPNAS